MANTLASLVPKFEVQLDAEDRKLAADKGGLAEAQRSARRNARRWYAEGVKSFLEYLGERAITPTTLVAWATTTGNIEVNIANSQRLNGVRKLLAFAQANGFEVPEQEQPVRTIGSSALSGLRRAATAKHEAAKLRRQQAKQKPESEPEEPGQEAEPEVEPEQAGEELEEPEELEESEEPEGPEDEGPKETEEPEKPELLETSMPGSPLPDPVELPSNGAQQPQSILPDPDERPRLRPTQSPVDLVAPSGHLVAIYRKRIGLSPSYLGEFPAENIATAQSISRFLRQHVAPLFGPWRAGEVVDYGVAKIDTKGREGEPMFFPIEGPVTPATGAPLNALGGALGWASSGIQQPQQQQQPASMAGLLDEFRRMAERDRTLSQEQIEKAAQAMRAAVGGVASTDNTSTLRLILDTLEAGNRERDRRIEALLNRAELLAQLPRSNGTTMTPTPEKPTTPATPDPIAMAAAEGLRATIERANQPPPAAPSIGDVMSGVRDLIGAMRDANPPPPPPPPPPPSPPPLTLGDMIGSLKELAVTMKELNPPPPPAPSSPMPPPPDPNILAIGEAVKALAASVEALKQEANSNSLDKFTAQLEGVKRVTTMLTPPPAPTTGGLTGFLTATANLLHELVPIGTALIQQALANAPIPVTFPQSRQTARVDVARGEYGPPPPAQLPIPDRPAQAERPAQPPVQSQAERPAQPERPVQATPPVAQATGDPVRDLIRRVFAASTDEEQVALWQRLTALLSTRQDGRVVLELLEKGIRDPQHGKDNFVRLVLGFLHSPQVGMTDIPELAVARLADAIDHVLVPTAEEKIGGGTEEVVKPEVVQPA